MRIALDTNVLVGAFWPPRGLGSDVLNLVLAAGLIQIPTPRGFWDILRAEFD